MRCQWFGGNFGQPVYWSSGLCSFVAGEFAWCPCVVLGFSVGMEAFDELLPINVPWSQEFSDVLRIWT